MPSSSTKGKRNNQERRRRRSSRALERSRAKPEPGSILDNEVTKEFKLWFKKEWWVILSLILIFLLALFLRAYFYYPVATEDGYMLSGNDPFYHKQVIDHVQEDHEHLTKDPLINYPLIGTNPRPPVYDWSSALGGMALAPFFGGDTAQATWVFFIISPAFWGALTIFPVYFLGKEIFGKKAGIISALLMGVMASHIERSPAGFADHDAMVLFFVATSIFFLVKALGALKEKKWIEKWRKPRDIVIGVDSFFKENKIAVGYSVMSGVSIATIALIWKGFPYVFVIILGYFTVQLLFNHLKKIDSLGVFICVFITIATSLFVSFPYYAYFTTGTWMSPLYLLLAMIFVGIFLVPTRDQPWLIVIPLLISIVAVIMSALNYFAPDIAADLFSGGGYFIRSKLYDTIAEAQAPDMSRLTISYGPVTFYLALIGLVIAAIDIPKQWKPNYMLIILWCGLAIYMAMSAVRFMFNATPVFAILGGWITWRIIEWVDPSLRTFQRPETKFIYLYVGILTFTLTMLTYWRYYLELGDFELFQLILGLALIGMFSSLMAIYFVAKYNIYIGAVIFIAFLALWIAFSWHDEIEIFLFGLIIAAMVLVPILIFTGLRNRISGFRVELKHVGISLFIILLILTPNMWFAVDSAIPYESKRDFDPDSEILGAFGHSFPSEYWQAGEKWLAEQDTELPTEDRPAFISWWDYGFWTTYLGKHPTVADNFQAGYQLAGSFIAAQNESEAISLFAMRLMEGDYTRNTFKFSQGVKDIIIKYFDDGNTEDHPTLDKIFILMDTPRRSESVQNKLMAEVENNREIYGNYTDIKIQNAVYAGIRVILTGLGQTTLVQFLKEIEDETGTSIRYFAVDTRLFPFTAQNTGIFYAPIRLADRDISDFIKYAAIVEYRTYSGGEWTPFRNEPIPVERIPGAMNDIEDVVDEYGANNVRIQKYSISYTNMFYNSMFYRCYIGWYGSEIGQSNDAVPGINDNDGATQLDNYPPLQGWNMTHFRLVYRTAYWSPHNESELRTNEEYQEDWVAMGELEAQKLIRDTESDGIDNNNNGETDESGEGGILSSGLRQGVFFLKYYHGAIIRGKVTTSTEPKLAVPGVRVTVLDEFGIPHDVDYTDKDGNYEIIAPFGDCQVVLSQGGFDESNIVFAKLSGIEQSRLAGEVITISDAQAMRAVPNYIVEKDFEVSSAALEGSVHWDYDDNEEYNEETDELILDLEVDLKLINNNPNLNLTYEPAELKGGNFKFENVIPGDYILQSEISGHLINASEPITVKPGASLLVNNISINPSSVEGFIHYQNSTPVSGIQIMLHDLVNDNLNYYKLTSNGSYRFDKILPGKYELIVNESGFEPFEQFMELGEGFNNITNITFIQIGKITGMTWYDKNKNGFGVEDIQANVKIYIKNIDTNANTSIVTAKTGEYEIELIEGNYTFYVRHIINDISYVHLSYHYLKAGTQSEIPIELEDGLKFNGTVYKLVAQEVDNATITFESLDNSGNLTILKVPTNDTGDFRVYLPYREYTLKGSHISSGNVKYIYYNRTDLTSKVTSEAIDIQMEEASRPWGYIYWDRNGDGMLSGNLSTSPSGILLGEASDLESLLPPEDPGTTAQTLGSPAYEYPGATEILSGVKIIFSHLNGSVATLSNGTGYFEILVPPGNNRMSIEDVRFEPLDKSMAPENITIIAPENGLDTDGIPTSIMVIPRNMTVKGTTWFDSNNNEILDDDQNEIITGLPVEFVNISVGAKYLKVISDEITGEYSASLVPGVYSVMVNYTEEPGATGIYNYSSNISIPYYSLNRPEIVLDLQFVPLIRINYTIMYNDEVLTGEVAGNNLTIKFIDNLNNITTPLDSTELTYEGYIEAKNYNVWVEYIVQEGDNAIRYINLSTHKVGPKYGNKVLELKASIKYEGKTFIDRNGNNSYEVGTDEPVAISEIVFIREDGSKLIASSDSKGDYEVYLIPGYEYEIAINYTMVETSGGNDVNVRYIFNDKINSFEPEAQTFYNISVIKYLQITGTVFFDENDNGMFDSEEGLNNSIINFRDIGFENNEDSEIMSAVSNSTGYYELFIKPGDYEITIDLFGFREVPEYKNGGTSAVIEYTKYELLQVDISINNPKIDFMLLPTLVEVSGLIFYDANENLTYELDEMLLGEEVFIEFIPDSYKVDEPSYLEFETKSILGAENEAYKNHLRETGENTLNRVTVVKPIGDQSDSENFGKYSMLLTPGTYNVHLYTTSGTGQLYAALDRLQLNLFEDSHHNLSMNEGLRVHGNVYYQDTDDKYVYDISKNVLEGGLKFESKSTDGELVVGYDNGFYELILGLGNYTVSTDYQAREYDQEMRYSISETLWIQDSEVPYDIKLTKNEKHDLSLTVIGENEKMIGRGKYERSFFTLKLENQGNVKTNVINLEVEQAPEGWDVRLNPSTISLDLIEPNDSGLVTVDVTAALNALAENTIIIKAESEDGGSSTRDTVELIVDTPKLYGFDIYSVDDVDRGISPNSSININITVEMAGNTGDVIIFDVQDLPVGWDAVIEAGEIVATPDGKFRHSYAQEELKMVYKNVTLKITSADIPDAYLYSLAQLKLVGTSENSSKSKSIEIKAEIRDPDLTVTAIEVVNADLFLGFNMTVYATVRSANTAAINVPVSLYVDNELIANNTIDYIPEDSERNVTFEYGLLPADAEALMGNRQKFEVVVNSNQTLSESQPYNNALKISQLIGQRETEEEFNWRPVYAALIVVIAMIVALVLYMRSKKI